MFAVSFSGSASATAEPLLSSLSSSRTRRRPRPYRHADARPRPARHRAARCRRARACARESRVGRGLHGRFRDEHAAADRRRGTGAAPTGMRDRRRAADRRRRRNRHKPAARSAPRAAAAVRPCAVRLRTPCGLQRQPRPPQRILALWADERLGHAASRENGGAGRQAAIVVDHAEAGNQAGLGIGHLAAERLRGELAHGLDQAEKAAGRAGLPDRKLPARGVVRKGAVVGETCGSARSPAPRPCGRSRGPRAASSTMTG